MTKIPNKPFTDMIDQPSSDGVDRRGFLQCMAWAGAGLIWTVAGGVPVSNLLGASPHKASSGFTFAQISDSHIGFDKPANTDVTATLQAAIDKVNALPTAPDLILHTGDISHLAKPGEFDTAMQVLKAAKSTIFYVPGEHDVATDNGQQYQQRFGKDASGAGWHSFDHKGVHFVGLVNVVDLKAGGLGRLGPEQVEWLERDLKGHTSSTPVVVFAHIPLWAVYPEWGWGTQDSEQALSYLKRFGSVTVLNGHIHQIMQKVEGNVTFHTAMATAFPQPLPGTSKGAGPLKVPADNLRHVLGITEVNYTVGQHHLAVVDASLAGTPTDQASDILRNAAASAPAATQQNPAQSGSIAATIDNHAFSPKDVTLKAGSTLEWTNKDDDPHTVTSNDGSFGSGALDTNDKFKHTFSKAGSFPYYCKYHPKMTGTVIVQ